MRAIVVEEPGGPEVLQLRDAPEPVLREGDLLIEVKAAGVNRADLLQRLGRYPPPGESAIIGMEIAGVVREVAPGAAGSGPGGHSFARGDRVMALLGGGGYAERARVPASQAMVVPDNISFLEAAALPEVFLTAWLNLFLLGGLREGEVCVVHAAASGVGTAALQLCRGVASVILATASSGKLPSLAQFGATHLLARAEVPARLAEAVVSAAGRGADLILDLVGASYLEANVAALGMHGRLVCLATQGGARGTLDLGAMLQRRLTVSGSTLRTRTREEKARLCADFSQKALPRFSRGELRPVLAMTFPLAQAAEAHARLARDEVVGKIVLEVAG